MGFWQKLKNTFSTKENVEVKQNDSQNTVNEDVVQEESLVEPKPEPKVVQKQKTEKDIKKEKKQKEKEIKSQRAIAKASLNFSKDIKKLSKKYQKINDDFFDELEEILIKTDMGMKMVLKISNSLRRKVSDKTSHQEVKELIVDEIGKLYDEGKKDTILNFQKGRLNIFMVVGVNGTGKTTSLSKIANFYAEQGNKVLIAAGDTFRAGAVEQLEEWVNSRIKNVDLIRGNKANQDPASVVFDAIQKAESENYDLLLIDTAGRLQNKINLMNELEKMHDIVHKFHKNAPHEVLMVIDATTGQNGVIQAQSFSEVTNVSGIVLTKMDGTSKGGIALAIKDQMDIPVKLMGVGEQVDDIVTFNVEEYIYGLVSGFMEDDGEDNE